MSSNLLALLPEILMTITGVLIMLIEPVLPPTQSRKGLGWLAILGTVAAAAATWYQHHLVIKAGGAAFTAFYRTVQVDEFSVFFHLLIAAVVVAVLLASLDYFEGPTTHAGEYFALVIFGATGMMFMTCSVELLMVFIGLEISSISTYILAGFRKGQATASESAIKYFLLGSFATAFFLYGIALCFGATGSTSIGAIAAGMAHTATPRLGILAIVSAAPFHVWTPDVYQGAPAPVVALMSTAPKAAAFAVLLRFLFGAMPLLHHQWVVLIYILAVASMTIGNLGALLQRDVKRLLAYSSIAHAGYLLVAFTGTERTAVAGALFYTAAYAAMNVGAFLVITELSGYGEGARSLEDFTGMAQRKPVLAALLSFFLLSLIGIPFTGGFFGTFYAFSGAIGNGYIWLALIGLANSGVACFYYLRLLAALYGRPLNDSLGYTPTRKLTVPAGLALAGTALATLALGVFPGHLLNLVQRAVPATLPAYVEPLEGSSLTNTPATDRGTGDLR